MTTIVTLGMDQASADWFNVQRQQHYPPALNRIPAHLSLFHALPGDGSTRHVLQSEAERTPGFALNVTGLRSMGRGVLYALESPELMSLHETLAGHFRTYLTPQDKQPLRPHVVVQNKVEPAETKALLAHLEGVFKPRTVDAVGLDWWEYLGGPWRLLEHFPFAASAAVVGNCERKNAPSFRIERVTSFAADEEAVLEEYYAALAVTQRDDADRVRRLLQEPGSAMWLARSGKAVAGFVVLRAGVPEPTAGECKRLFVRPAYRGRGVADALMDALETFARLSGREWVYLDTNQAFAASVRLYRRRGYETCERYNVNPQATLFFRKRM